MRVILANPRGFCAGVERAINIVELALEKYGAPIYVRHEIVHNKYVVENLKNKGVIFIDEIDEVPQGKITIFSAHGVSKKVVSQAREMNMQVIDATCPLVTKVHKQAIKHFKEGKKLILIGHKDHPEVIGTAGQIEDEVIIVESVNDVENLNIQETPKAYVTQTTLSVDDTAKIVKALKEKFPYIEGPELKDICYATQNRQNAVRELAKFSDLILVIGAQNSSNSNRLRDLALEQGVKSYLINTANDINIKDLKNVKNLGITAGASAPEILIKEVLDSLKEHYNIEIEELNGVIEMVKFRLPEELRS